MCNAKNALTTARPSGTDSQVFVKGHAYAGVGRCVSRVELLIPGTDKWREGALKPLQQPCSDSASGGWAFWSVLVSISSVKNGSEILIRTWDDTQETSVLNAPSFRVKVHILDGEQLWLEQHTIFTADCQMDGELCVPEEDIELDEELATLERKKQELLRKRADRKHAIRGNRAKDTSANPQMVP